MIGIIDVGGGMRDIYGAGVFDYLLDNDIDIEYCIGVSAGSANIASYASGQRGRNLRFYTVYSKRKEYMGFGQLLRKGNFLNLDYIYGALADQNGEDPFDYSTFKDSDKEFYVVCTDAHTGLPRYYSKEDVKLDDYGIIKGSSCLPVVNQPYKFNGRKLYDGGLSDPIPYKKAFNDGCDKVIVILTRPKDYMRKPNKDRRMAKIIKVRYPKAAEALANRADTYNKSLLECKELEKEGKVLILAPEDISGLKTLTTDRKLLMGLYEEGYAAAKEIPKFMLTK